jgi:hypothetical protein
MMCSVEIGKQKQIHLGQKELTRSVMKKISIVVAIHHRKD